MKKRFNVTGSCNPQRCYMVDLSPKLDDVMELIENGDYFTINRPRQYGKTTMLNMLAQHIWLQKDKYVLIRLSFEGIGDNIFESEEQFVPELLDLIAIKLEPIYPDLSVYVKHHYKTIENLKQLSTFITSFVQKADREVILLIDEVDKSSNNQLFLSFLGTLRDKFIERDSGIGATFLSVVLAGVHDIKSLQLKYREGENTKLNSPWNIASDFNVDMSFSPEEIETMLLSYTKDKNIKMDHTSLAERIHYYTNGYPFLVSKICKIIDEEATLNNPTFNQNQWIISDIDWSFRWLTREDYTTTNFDALVKNLENNPKLYKLVEAVLFGYQADGIPFSRKEPTINLGILLGILDNKNGKSVIHNRIYEQILTDYIRARKFMEDELPQPGVELSYYKDNKINMKQVLLNFQRFMKENYSKKDKTFYEREGRLILLSFLKPIVNGNGSLSKEPVIGDERRIDLLITYGQQIEVVETKIWRGPAYHKRGLEQLAGYLEMQERNSGFMLIFDFSKNKQYKAEMISHKGKKIFAVWV